MSMYFGLCVSKGIGKYAAPERDWVSGLLYHQQVMAVVGALAG